MKAAEIRDRFLKYFEENGHTQVPSSPIIPRDDPSLMFTNAGMVQFKKTFLGQEKRDYVRACSSQKCLRVGGKHNDLENVGRTARHHTFFEMLGNFSFGDYFKKEAIRLAWDFCTRELGLAADNLYITIFRDDDQADELWKEVAGVPAERIFRLGEKDNFWSMGDTGPCGPCSEIHYDQGEAMACGPDCGIGKCECDRYLEIWNLVFMQFDQDGTGKRVELPRPSIDTGMGLERIAAVCQGVTSNYETDLFTPIIDFAAKKAGVQYKKDGDTDTALQVIADHSRAVAFLITDNILPSNEGRGYVLRRLIRRAFRFGRFIGLTVPFLHETVDKVVQEMGGFFTELTENRDFMVRMVREEEERFALTLDKGLAILEEEMEALEKKGEKTISGETAFKLYDTYGFPLDIVNDIAEKRGLAVDEPRFKECMAEQRERAKKAWKGSGEKDVASLFQVLLETGTTSGFSGYETLEDTGGVTALLDPRGKPVDRITASEGGWLVTDRTPFYGESGGQMGDTGTASTMTGRADVLDTVKPSPKLTAHKVFVAEGEFLPEQEVRLNVDAQARRATERNHTCTHLLHAALRSILGEHVKQSGSLVGPDRLRFDFTHIAPLSVAEIRKVEETINRAVIEDLPVVREEMSFAQAKESGAVALFDEKYQDTVCVVQVPGVSAELCGGTHLSATGQAGVFVILSETGVASGIRRIEAATGLNALNFLQEQRDELAQVQELLKARSGETADKVKGLQAQVRDKTKEVERLEAKLASGAGSDIMASMEEIAGVKVLAAKSEVSNVKSLREQVDALRSKVPSGIVCLGAELDGGKASIVVSVSKDLTDRFKAPDLVKAAAAEVGGSGGGRPDMAQAGGTDPSGLDRAMEALKKAVSGG